MARLNDSEYFKQRRTFRIEQDFQQSAQRAHEARGAAGYLIRPVN